MILNLLGKNAPGDAPVTSQAIAKVFEGCYDFETREVFIGGDRKKRVTLTFIDGLVSGGDIAEQVIRPLTDKDRFGEAVSIKDSLELMAGGSVYVYTVKRRNTLGETAADMLSGFCAVIFDGQKCALTFEVKSDKRRNVDAPKEEKVVKGSKDAFVETMKINSALVRRKIANPNLKIKQVKIGSMTETAATIVYVDGFTNPDMVSEVTRRMENISTDEALTSSIIEENIVDNPNTPFPQMIVTERPDKFCINILEGRVGILVDGLPMGYLAPGTFSQYMKVPEDHSEHFLIASALTVLRYFSLLLTLLLPAFYVAVAMYHQEMIPSRLLQSMIDSKQSVPFPTAAEVLMMLIAFELLQEAGLRLPNPVGETVSIIGALIVGQSAVEARVVSPIVVVVIALAGIAGYTQPSLDMSAALRICRFLLVLFAIGLGMFGLVIGCGLLINHLARLESFGVAYMTPFAGADGRHLSRALLRFPMRSKRDREPALRTRPGGEAKIK